MSDSVMLDGGAACKQRLVEDCIMDWIRRGDYGTGDRLPSEKELARVLSINHRTVRAGLDVLERRNLVERRPRSGTYVAQGARQTTSTQIAIALPDFLLKAEEASHAAIAIAVRAVGRVFPAGEGVTPVMFYRPGCLWKDVARPASARGVKGLLLWPQFEPLNSWRDGLQAILDAGMDVAVTDYLPGDDFSGLNVFAAHVEVLPALASMFERAVEIGHRRIVAFVYSSPERISRRIQDEIRRLTILHEIGHPDDHLFVLDNPYPAGADYSVLREVFDRPQRPTAILVEDEVMAAAVWRECHRRRWVVPHDLSVAALWDMNPAMHPVRLTSSDTRRLWGQAAELGAIYLKQRLEAGREDADVCMRTELTAKAQWRESLAAPGVTVHDALLQECER